MPGYKDGMLSRVLVMLADIESIQGLMRCQDTRMERYYTNLDGVDDTMDPSN